MGGGHSRVYLYAQVHMQRSDMLGESLLYPLETRSLHVSIDHHCSAKLADLHRHTKPYLAFTFISAGNPNSGFCLCKKYSYPVIRSPN